MTYLVQLFDVQNLPRRWVVKLEMETSIENGYRGVQSNFLNNLLKTSEKVRRHSLRLHLWNVKVKKKLSGILSNVVAYLVNSIFEILQKCQCLTVVGGLTQYLICISSHQLIYLTRKSISTLCTLSRKNYTMDFYNNIVHTSE